MSYIQNRLASCAQKTNAELARLYSEKREDTEALAKLREAEKYSLLDGGKRIRPFLVFEFCRMLGGHDRAALPFALAVEMVHTYSLIHDDLPCMDDDDLRRGKPTNHKAFGVPTALLAGDSLLTLAFETIADNEFVSAETAVWAVKELARAAGGKGMVGGQIMDLEGENRKTDLATLEKTHRLKTGAMICCAARLGVLAAGKAPDDAIMKHATEYAQNIGLAFQVIDDIFDVCGDVSVTGKNGGMDAARGKTTYMSFFDEEGAKKYASELTSRAVTAISGCHNSEILTDFAVWLLERDK